MTAAYASSQTILHALRSVSLVPRLSPILAPLQNSLRAPMPFLNLAVFWERKGQQRDKNRERQLGREGIRGRREIKKTGMEMEGDGGGREGRGKGEEKLALPNLVCKFCKF